MNLVLFAILFAGVLQGLILAVLLLWKKSSRFPNRVLAVILFVMVAHLSLVAIDVQDLFIRFPHLSRLTWVIPLLYGPLFLLFTQSIIIPAFRLQPRHLVYLAPFVIYLVSLSPYFFSAAETKLAILQDPVRLQQADFGMYNYVTNYIHIFFGTVAILVFYRYKKRLPDYFSDGTRAEFPWLERFLWAVLGIMIFSYIVFLSRRYDVSHLSGLYPYNFLLVVGLIYWLSYKLLLNRQELAVPAAAKEVVQPMPLFSSESVEIILSNTGESSTDDNKKAKYQKTQLPPEELVQIREKLEAWMGDKKPYLEPELTLDDLSQSIGVKRHHLSQVINTCYDRNFFEFINYYRIEEFKSRVRAGVTDQLSIMGLAFDCGFNSKATFNQAFKKQVGMTPSAFIRQEKGTELKG